VNQIFSEKKYISKSNTVNYMKLMILAFAHVPSAHAQRVFCLNPLHNYISLRTIDYGMVEPKKCGILHACAWIYGFSVLAGTIIRAEE